MTAPGPSDPLNNEAGIGPHHWPPAPGTGVIRVKIKTAIDTDVQKPSGSDPARAKLKGRKPAEVSCEFEWTRRAEKEGNAIRLDIDPAGPNYGKIWDFTHPEANNRGVRSVMFETMSDLVTVGDKFSFSTTGKGWSEPAKARVGGGTQTPLTSEAIEDELRRAIAASVAYGKSFTSGRGVALGEIQPTGFDGPSAPDAKP